MASMLFSDVLVVVRGGGDLATGVIYRLSKAGFPVIVTELARPLAIRRAVAVSSAVFDGAIEIEGLRVCRAAGSAEARALATEGQIPVLVDPDAESLTALRPAVIVDARMAKRNLGTRRAGAPLVIALGPGFSAGDDCHAVIETNRGHRLGRVIWHGRAEPDTGRPGAVQGKQGERVLRAPADGTVEPRAVIGDRLAAGDVVATVSGAPVLAPFGGVLRGLIHPSVFVTTGMKIGDVDPRGERAFCFEISEKALAIGGGVVEAVLSAPQTASMLLVARHQTR
ncbi:MAG: selenium-dependent molybdenum cofactor biosynthesis protein YqeB [Chloroflexota bacterium]|nr:selenium-dependent molybdenum cofactor biosynthesis protein YqeB [Aggregatilineaceae bacterium]